jgi:hypothetical protein
MTSGNEKKTQPSASNAAPLLSSNSTTQIALPGLNLPLNWTPHAAYNKRGTWKPGLEVEITKVPACGSGKDLFPNALSDVDFIS